ncbi:MAG: hypothetical protein MZV63_37260 [Marinilabiliales bacterium]|nr:hypothetical protein [Marinilabiliales bacterium]
MNDQEHGCSIRLRYNRASHPMNLLSGLMPRGDGFSITKDRLILGCEVLSCRHENNHSIEKQSIGHGEIRVTSDGGKVTYAVDLPEGCPLSEKDIIPLCFRGKHLPEQTLLLETPYAFPLSHGEKFFDRIAVYDIDPKLIEKRSGDHRESGNLKRMPETLRLS